MFTCFGYGCGYIIAGIIPGCGMSVCPIMRGGMPIIGIPICIDGPTVGMYGCGIMPGNTCEPGTGKAAN